MQNFPRRAVQLKITIHMHSPIKFSKAGGVIKLGKHKSQKMLITKEFSVMFIRMNAYASDWNFLTKALNLGFEIKRSTLMKSLVLLDIWTSFLRFVFGLVC